MVIGEIQIHYKSTLVQVMAWRQTDASLQWRHNECDGVSNHWRLICLLNRLFRRRSKKTSKVRVTGLCEGNPPVTEEINRSPVDSPHKGPVTGKMFPFDVVIMTYRNPVCFPACNLLPTYRKVSNIRRTKCQKFNDSRLVFQLSLPNPLKPSVRSIMKM